MGEIQVSTFQCMSKGMFALSLVSLSFTAASRNIFIKVSCGEKQGRRAFQITDNSCHSFQFDVYFALFDTA